jgi:RND superfamily putative drug exporter
LNKIFVALGNFSVRFRYVIVPLWIAVIFASVAFLPSLSSVVTNNNQNFLPKNSPSIQAANLASSFQNTNDSLVEVVVYRNQGTLTPADEAYAAQLATAIKAHVPTIVKSQVVALSKDQQAEQIEVLSSISTFNDVKTVTLVDNIRSEIAKVSAPAGLQVHTAGQLATAVDSAKTNGSNFNATQQYSIVFILLILLLVFRSVLAPLITLIPAALVSVMAGPIVARLTSVLHFQVSNITQLLMVVLVLGAGTDYGLFLVFRVREEIRRGLDGREAVRFAVSRVGESITFSAFTVIAALLSLVTATFGFYKGLGYPLAITIFLMLLAGLTLQPALLAIFGRAAFWPSRPHKTSPKNGLWGRIAAKVITRPVLTLTAGVLVFGSLAIVSIGNKPSGFTSSTSVPANSDSALGNAALQKHFKVGAFNPTQIIFKFNQPIWGNLPAVADIENKLSSSKEFSSVQGMFNLFGIHLTPQEIYTLHSKLGNPSLLPPVEPPTVHVPKPLYEAFRSVGNYVSPSGKLVFFNTSLSAGDPGSTAAIDSVPAIRALTTSLQKSSGAVASGVGGEAPASADISAASNSDLFHIVPLVVVIIAVLLAVVLRSLIAPLYLVVSVLLSYLAALGIDVLYFMDIKGESGLTFVLPFMLFLFLLALGEDYNILVMTRIREESHSMPLKKAVATAIGATGSTVTSAGIVLAGTFFVLGVAGGSGSPQVQQIGLGLGLGIVMDTFLVRTLLVPSTVVLLGKWNWWPSKLHETHAKLETQERTRSQRAHPDSSSRPSPAPAS